MGTGMYIFVTGLLTGCWTASVFGILIAYWFSTEQIEPKSVADNVSAFLTLFVVPYFFISNFFNYTVYSGISIFCWYGTLVYLYLLDT